MTEKRFTCMQCVTKSKRTETSRLDELDERKKKFQENTNQTTRHRAGLMREKQGKYEEERTMKTLSKLKIKTEKAHFTESNDSTHSGNTLEKYQKNTQHHIQVSIQDNLAVQIEIRIPVGVVMNIAVDNIK